MTELRFITCGDPHIYGGVNGTNGIRLQRAVNLANQAFSQGKLDFIAILGDIADTVYDTYEKERDAATILNMLTSNLTRFKVAGNHDVIGSECTSNCPNPVTGNLNPIDKSCIFRTYQGVYPQQFYTITKTGKTFNIIIPGICIHESSNPSDPWSIDPSWYFNFNNPSINKSLPTFVFNHGPVKNVSGQGWTTFDYYAQTMNNYLAEFPKLIGVYAGHVHQDTNQTINNIRYVTNDSIDDRGSNFVGYTRVNDDNTTDYTTIRFRNSDGSQATFTDPFPSVCATPTCSFTII